MNHRNHVFIVLLIPVLLSSELRANTSSETVDQLAAIEVMGQLYGIALPCDYIQQTRRIKRALVAALPKKRYLGQAFEEATNDSFLNFHKQGGNCPDEEVLAKEIDVGIESINAVFKE